MCLNTAETDNTAVFSTAVAVIGFALNCTGWLKLAGGSCWYSMVSRMNIKQGVMCISSSPPSH